MLGKYIYIKNALYFQTLWQVRQVTVLNLCMERWCLVLCVVCSMSREDSAAAQGSTHSFMLFLSAVIKWQ